MPGWTLVVALVIWGVLVVWALVTYSEPEEDEEHYRTNHGRHFRRPK